MTSLLMDAAQRAAAADGIALDQGASAGGMMQPPPQAAPPSKSNKNKGPPLRRGKWTAEEEAYANRLIQEFKAGLLPLTDGTTLRTFLSKLLNCDPMRISKKFVGSNCIGKQVFRRRTADLNRLTPEQIQKSRAELSELERRFLERVAQTNRVKSNSMANSMAGASAAAVANAAALQQSMGGGSGGQGLGGGFPGMDQGGMNPQHAALLMEQQRLLSSGGMGGGMGNGFGADQNPPWLAPPSGYRQGQGAAFAAANLTSSNPSAAAAGRALLGGGVLGSSQNDPLLGAGNASSGALSGGGSAGDLLAQLQRRASQQSFLQGALGSNNNSSTGLSSAALAQLAQNASAARLAGLNGSNPSLTNLALAQNASALAAARGLSSASLSNAMNRKNSFDALMSLDFQSLQSIDNLANLIQTGGVGSNVPQAGMKNADFGSVGGGGSNSNLHARLASAGRMGSLLSNHQLAAAATASPSASNASLHNASAGAPFSSSANLNNLLQSMANDRESTASLNSASALNLANLLRQDSATGLSALRVQEGLANRNTSVDDFLSLMAAGDIPHQDPSLLNIPLMQQQLKKKAAGAGGEDGNQQEAAARLLAQQRLLQSNPSFANALSSQFNLQQAAAAASGEKRKADDLGPDGSEQGNMKKSG